MSQNQPQYSADFYRDHAERYAEVAHQYLQSVYLRASHPHLKGDEDLLNHLKTLISGKRGLDAGCGAGARDVYQFFQDGYDMWGIDAVDENVKIARERHPEIKERVRVHDLREPLPFPDADFDFVMCNAVIQHIEPDDVSGKVLPELMRVLRPNGVLQLMFKNGEGIATVYDEDYGIDRTFLLYDEQRILARLNDLGGALVKAQGDGLGGVMYFTDPKPMEHCVFWVRKTEKQ